jgi:glutathione S-transferase
VDPYRIIGGPGSPYSLKLRAVMRYRQIPHTWALRVHCADEIAHVHPRLLPTLYDPYAQDYFVDSTPLIARLEDRHDKRSVMPANDADAFIALLIEDMADEWFTKFMFSGRWHEPVDADFYGQYLGWFATAPSANERYHKASQTMRDRQVGRNAVVGVTPDNAPVIDATFRELAEILEDAFATQMFLFGNRPSVADFAIYGQLQPTLHAPTASTTLRDVSPRAFFWTILLDDLSGYEPGKWLATSAHPSNTIDRLLGMAGKYYLPFAAANLEAIEADEAVVELDLAGHRFRQPAFRYQAKCLRTLRYRYAALAPSIQADLERSLANSNCLGVLSA